MGALSSFLATPATITWRGESGADYLFNIYSIDSIPGWIGPCNYMFARRVHWGSSNPHAPIYTGEKGDTDRLNNHPKMEAARRLGADEIHICYQAINRSQRLAIETDLRHAWQPPLNEQSVPVQSGLGALSALCQSDTFFGGLLPQPANPFESNLAAFGSICGPVPSPAPMPYAESIADLLNPPNPFDYLSPGWDLARLLRGLKK